MHSGKIANSFTLIELIIVIAISWIIAAIAIPQYEQNIQYSRVTDMAADLKMAVNTTIADFALVNVDKSVNILDSISKAANYW